MDHWPLHARSWARIGPPLRPSAEDVAIMTQTIHGWARGRAIELLVLGVTPELVALDLPAGSSAIAVDRERAMIDALFRPTASRGVVQGDWRALPLRTSSIDVAVGDGCTTLIPFPAGHDALAGELARVVRTGGLVAIRLFTAPPVPESFDDLRTALPSIQRFDALKWRIAMAIQPPARAVPVAAIRDAFDALVPDRAALAAQTGWTREVIDQIDNYRGSTATYSFPTLDEVRAVADPHFDAVAVHVPGYELGDRCPTLVLRRR